ncbi:hypothetical protein [Streptosporangium canum]|uniref:hypothetical protein n=1 Tax=Streptosporangium canum TaxID=324952 RepID=UPI0033AE80DD
MERDAAHPGSRPAPCSKESDSVTRFTDDFSTVATRENTPREGIRKRLPLVPYAPGIND